MSHHIKIEEFLSKVLDNEPSYHPCLNLLRQGLYSGKMRTVSSRLRFQVKVMKSDPEV
jgi:hypothetical protein